MFEFVFEECRKSGDMSQLFGVTVLLKRTRHMINVRICTEATHEKSSQRKGEKDWVNDKRRRENEKLEKNTTIDKQSRESTVCLLCDEDDDDDDKRKNNKQRKTRKRESIM